MRKRNKRGVFEGFERRDDELERNAQMLRAKSRALRQSAPDDAGGSDDEDDGDDVNGLLGAAAAGGDGDVLAEQHANGGAPKSSRGRRARRAQAKSTTQDVKGGDDGDADVPDAKGRQQPTAAATRGHQRGGGKRGKGRKGRGKQRGGGVGDESSSDGEDAALLHATATAAAAAAATKKTTAAAATAPERRRDNGAAVRRERKLPRHLQGQERLKIRGSLPEHLSLPNEVWAMIIDFLDKKDLLLMSAVCVDWRWLALSYYRHHRVRNCDNLIGQLDFLSANCPHLDSLVLTGWWSVGMGDEFKHLPSSIAHLDISNSEHVIDSHLSLLPRGLRSLNLSACHNISNHGLSLLPPALERLDISECFLVSDAGLRNLSGVVGQTRDEIEEEERERARLAAEEKRIAEEEIERRLRKGKEKAYEDDQVSAHTEERAEHEAPIITPDVIAALPDLVSDDDEDDDAVGAPATTNGAAGTANAAPSIVPLSAVRHLPVMDNPPFPYLTSLKLHKCFAISSLDFLPRTLEELDISHLNLNFAGQCFTLLPPTMKRLTVTDCRVSNDSLWDLPPSLVYLDLTRCYFITDDGLQALFNMPYLKTLVVRACSRIHGDGLVTLPGSLEQLVISETNIADESLDTLPASIKKLDLSFTSISNRALLHLPPALEELNLGWCKNIDDEGLAALPSTLRGLSLEDNLKNISDRALAHLYNNQAKSLRVLNLVGCDRITDEGLRWLPRNVTTLCLTLRPANISKNAIKKLQLGGRVEVKIMESQRRRTILQATKAQ